MGLNGLTSLLDAIQEPTLRVLVANRAGLECTIPSELGRFSSLESLSLHGNSICNTIPSFSGDLPCLERLDLSSNCLAGLIPTELGRASQLRTLYLQDNCLEGALPSELKYLSRVNLSRNQLTGCLPNRMFGLNIQELDLSFNLFSSLAPDVFADMTNLTNCKLNNNRLEGSIPSSIGRLTVASEVDLSHICFTSIPSELGQVGREAIRKVKLLLHDNSITGSMPPQVFNGHVGVLDLSNNRLNGRLPSEVGSLRYAETLNLANNRLSGSVPCELGILHQTNRVDISGNRFQGKLPKGVSTLGRACTQHATLVFDDTLVYNYQQIPKLVLVTKSTESN